MPPPNMPGYTGQRMPHQSFAQIRAYMCRPQPVTLTIQHRNHEHRGLEALLLVEYLEQLQQPATATATAYPSNHAWQQEAAASYRQPPTQQNMHVHMSKALASLTWTSHWTSMLQHRQCCRLSTTTHAGPALGVPQNVALCIAVVSSTGTLPVRYQ
jgi:hypothetical protein